MDNKIKNKNNKTSNKKNAAEAAAKTGTAAAMSSTSSPSTSSTQSILKTEEELENVVFDKQNRLSSTTTTTTTMSTITSSTADMTGSKSETEIKITAKSTVVAATKQIGGKGTVRRKVRKNVAHFAHHDAAHSEAMRSFLNKFEFCDYGPLEAVTLIEDDGKVTTHESVRLMANTKYGFYHFSLTSGQKRKPSKTKLMNAPEPVQQNPAGVSVTSAGELLSTLERIDDQARGLKSVNSSESINALNALNAHQMRIFETVGADAHSFLSNLVQNQQKKSQVSQVSHVSHHSTSESSDFFDKIKSMDEDLLSAAPDDFELISNRLETLRTEESTYGSSVLIDSPLKTSKINEQASTTNTSPSTSLYAARLPSTLDSSTNETSQTKSSKSKRKKSSKRKPQTATSTNPSESETKLNSSDSSSTQKLRQKSKSKERTNQQQERERSLTKKNVQNSSTSINSSTSSMLDSETSTSINKTIHQLKSMTSLEDDRFMSGKEQSQQQHDQILSANVQEIDEIKELRNFAFLRFTAQKKKPRMAKKPVNKSSTTSILEKSSSFDYYSTSTTTSTTNPRSIKAMSEPKTTNYEKSSSKSTNSLDSTDSRTIIKSKVKTIFIIISYAL